MTQVFVQTVQILEVKLPVIKTCTKLIITMTQLFPLSLNQIKQKGPLLHMTLILTQILASLVLYQPSNNSPSQTRIETE